MSVTPFRKTWNTTKPARPDEWQPHYEAKYTDRQVARFEATEYRHVDSRTQRAMLGKVGVEVLLSGNPMNDDVVVLCTPQGFYKEVHGEPSEMEVEWENGGIGSYVKVDFKIFSINVPTGIGKLAYVFRNQKMDDGSFRVMMF